MSKLKIGQAKCQYCDHVTTTGGIKYHMDHCPKNPNAKSGGKRRQVMTTEEKNNMPPLVQKLLIGESTTPPTGAALKPSREVYAADNEYPQDIYKDGQFVFSFSFSKTIPDDQQASMVKTVLGKINTLQAEGAIGEGWISVEDNPLFTKDEKGNWTCTESGDKAFLAAVPYNDNKRPEEKNLWWIMPCVVEDGIGLCIIGDDENEPAGWQLEDVTYYKLLDLTPPSSKHTEGK